MKKSISPAFAVVLVLAVVAVAAYFLYQGTGPQREPNAMSKEDIYKQMRSFNQTGKPPAAAQAGH